MACGFGWKNQCSPFALYVTKLQFAVCYLQIIDENSFILRLGSEDKCHTLQIGAGCDQGLKAAHCGDCEVYGSSAIGMS